MSAPLFAFSGISAKERVISVKQNKTFAAVLSAALLVGLLAGCGSGKNTASPAASAAAASASPSAEAFQIGSEEIPLAAGLPASALSAVASGVSVQQNNKAVLDYSNSADGYIMLKYLGSNKKVKTQITGPSGVTYTYNQSLTGAYDVYVLSDGSGSYKIALFENISGTSYSTAFSYTISVSLKDEFAPFLRSNKYVNYSAATKVVAKAAELCKGQSTTNDKIKAVYGYVITNYQYDYNLAKSVKSGYIPDLDADFASKKGICFDYAATMTAMLRSQGVPTKMIFGYTGSTYHAWINTYSSESGWVTGSIYFNGKEWKLMDPTFASTGKSSAEIMKYIGNGANYTAKYIY